MEGNTRPDVATAGSTVLVVGDEGAADVLERGIDDLAAAQVPTADAALDRIRGGDVACVVSAYSLPEADGLDLLVAVRDEFPDLPFVLYAGTGDERVASDAIGAGVTDYVVRDDDPSRLVSSVEGTIPEGSAADRHANGETPVGGGPEVAPSERTDAARRADWPTPAGVFAVDDGEFVHANDRFAAMLGYDPGELVGVEVLSVVAPEDCDQVAKLFETPGSGGDPVRAGDGARRYAFTAVRSDGDPVDLECHAWRPDPDSPVVVGAALDVTNRETGERQLAALRDAMRRMMKTKDRERIGEIAVETVVEVLDPLVASVSLYDGTEGVLRTVASDSGVVDLFGGPGSLAGDDGIAWDAFVKGEDLVVDDVAAYEGADPDPTVGSEMVIPLGDHGVLAVGEAVESAFDDGDLGFVRTLATNTEVALDRANREETILERTEQLREQNEQLDHLRRIDAIVRDIGGMLVRATDREAIERGVCERLAAVNHWQFVWIGERPVTDEGITPRAWAGTPEGYVEAVQTASHGTPFADTPAEIALQTGDPQTRENVIATSADEAWRSVTLDHGFRSVTSIPLNYEHREYGVLEVYGDNPSMFGDAETDVLRELGDMIAYAINAVEREQALFADAGPEIEMSIPDEGAAAFFPRLATDVEATVTVDGIVPQSDGAYMTYVTVSGADPDAVAAAADRSPVVDRLRSIGPDDAGRFEVRLSESELFDTVASHGASIRGLSASGSGCSVRIELPVTANLRRFVEAFTAVYPDAEVTAQRSTFDADESVDVGARFTDLLTERQGEIIQIAYHSGFFEWPRESTGEEIAESLGVSPPTVHKHLRAAERKLLAAVLGSREE